MSEQEYLEQRFKVEKFAKESVREWYASAFPEDSEIAKEISPDLTFGDVLRSPQKGDCANDSFVRERVFTEMESQTKLPYDVFYYGWLNGTDSISDIAEEYFSGEQQLAIHGFVSDHTDIFCATENPQDIHVQGSGIQEQDNHPILNLQLARRAHEANSFREFNGERIQAGFNVEVSEAVEIGEHQKQRLAKLYPGVDLSEEYAKIDRLVNSFSRRLEAHYNKGFAIEASCPSIMIAGGSNFPTRKKEKQNTARGRHNEEYKEIKSIINSIEAVGTSIKGHDENAVDKLQVKIARLKEEQTHAKAMNAYYRKNGTVKGFDGVTDDEAARIDTEVKNAHSWARQPVSDYHLTSINNKIKEAEKRLQGLQPQTDLEIRLELEIGYYGESQLVPSERAPLTLENLAEHQAKLDESKGSAYISGKVFAGDRHTKIGEWVYSKNKPDVSSWYCVDLTKAISAGVSGGTVNKKIIADCWDAFLHGNTRSERQAEQLDGAVTIGEGKLRLEEGRINIYFDGKPDADVIGKLKSKAFKWSPSRMAWTRQDTPNARFAVKDLLVGDTPAASAQQTQEAGKTSVIDAIRADRENPRQPGTKTEKAKNLTNDER